MLFKNVTIGRRLFLGFGVLLLSTVLTGIVALRDINNLWKDTERLYKHPFTVSNAVRDVRIHILNIRRYMLNIALHDDADIVRQYQRLIDYEDSVAHVRFDDIFRLYLGDLSDIEAAHRMLEDWKPMRDAYVSKILASKNSDNTQVIDAEHLEFINELFRKSQIIIDFASGKAIEFYESSHETKQRAERILIVFISVTFGLSLLLSFLITSSLSKPLLQVVGKIREVSLGILEQDYLPESRDEIGQLAASYNLMQKNLLHKAEVAEQIGVGNLDQRVESKGERDIVANSINKIADNLSMVVKQAQKVAVGDFTAELTDFGKDNQLAQVIDQMLDSLQEVVDKARRIAQGDYTGELVPRSKSDELALALNQMTQSLRDATMENNRQTTLITAQNELFEQLRGELGVEDISKRVVDYLVKFGNAQLGALYLFDPVKESYTMRASYAFKHRKGTVGSYKVGEGLIGQAALEQEIITFSDLPDNYVYVSSGLGESLPRKVIVAPFVHNKQTVAVIEIATVNEFQENFIEFLTLVLENVAISLVTTKNRDEMEKLLSVTKEQAEELQVQQEELRQSNEELENQTKALKKSEEFLQAQQEELRVTNEELEEKTKNLEDQKKQITAKNTELERASSEIELKAKELEISSKYKSEFLANMSHELRTPLNSLLILSQTLAENSGNNLNDDQVESARIINQSGKDLLNLINDILDLSKIESGKVVLSPVTVSLDEVMENIRMNFTPLAAQKEIALHISRDDTLPATIYTDEQRFGQIIRNLLANAIKFTEQGSVSVHFFRPDSEVDLTRSGLNYRECIAMSVKDTGIGIAPEKQKEIFEAFQQADGSISRQFGGTGLGLSITRELTKMLQGEIHLNSHPGEGAEFIIYLPEKLVEDEQAQEGAGVSIEPIALTSTPIPEAKDVSAIRSIADDRNEVTEGDSAMLIIEDDNRFAEILAAKVHEKGYKCLAAATGEQGLELARKYLPKGIILDINLPGIDGWSVLQQLKNSNETRHIPVHIMSGYEENNEAFHKGAIGYLTKPASRESMEQAFDKMQEFIARDIKDLLVIEDDKNLRKSVCLLLKSSDINITACSTGKDAIEHITNQPYDCIVLDLGLPDMSGFEMLNILTEKKVEIPPIVVYTGREITAEENKELQRYTSNIIIKGVKSEERLLDETSLFMHRMVERMPDRQKKMLVNLYDKEQIFNEKTVLIVDDDMRNVFAVTQILESAKMNVIMAANGQKALDELSVNPNIDLVLMDIMMPVMDGYTAMQEIRKKKQFADLPIIALTAKAMKEDREKSIAAGANDYLSKPLDVEKLFNLMQIWLYK